MVLLLCVNVENIDDIGLFLMCNTIRHISTVIVVNRYCVQIEKCILLKNLYRHSIKRKKNAPVQQIPEKRMERARVPSQHLNLRSSRPKHCALTR